jgi:uncharacterized protein (DUF924 family)
VTPLDRSRAAALVGYWFDGATDEADIRPGHPCYRRWFGGGPEVDAEVGRAFADDMRAARAGACAGWSTPHEVLAQVLLLDQVPRHVYRGDGRAFDSDGAALELARRCMAGGLDERLRLVERVFLYLPIQHSERLDDHVQALDCYERLVRLALGRGLAIVGFLEAAVQAENEHRDLLDRFGRYPGRNAALGRTSTPAELDYLGTLRAQKA